MDGCSDAIPTPTIVRGGAGRGSREQLRHQSKFRSGNYLSGSFMLLIYTCRLPILLHKRRWFPRPRRVLRLNRVDVDHHLPRRVVIHAVLPAPLVVAHNRLDGHRMLEHHLRHPEGWLDVDRHDGIAVADGVELPGLVDVPHRAAVREVPHDEGRLLLPGEGRSAGLGRDRLPIPLPGSGFLLGGGHGDMYYGDNKGVQAVPLLCFASSLFAGPAVNEGKKK